MMKTVPVRLKSEVIERLDQQGHAKGYSTRSQYYRSILTYHSLLDLEEVPSGLNAQPWTGDAPEHSLMEPVLSRERALPGESVESFIHKLFSEKKAERGSNTNADRVR